MIALGAGRAEMEALRATAAEMAAHEAQRLAARQAAADATYRIGARSASCWPALAALAALIGFARAVAPPARARRGRGADRRASASGCATTLESIGDAVITTDLDGRVTQPQPRSPSRSPAGAREEAQGQPLEAVFRIVNESTREPVENPATAGACATA